MNNVEVIKANIKHMLAKLDLVFNFAKLEGIVLEYTKDNKKDYTNVYSIFNDNEGKLCSKTDLGIISLEDYIDKEHEWTWSLLETSLQNMIDEEEARKNS